MATTADLPIQPTIVRNWIEDRNRAVRAVNKLTNGAIRGAMTGLDGFDKVVEMRNAMIEDLAETLAPMPTDVARAYRTWVNEYNAVVTQINSERQARINRREVNKVRAAACPRCFSTHAGEC